MESLLACAKPGLDVSRVRRLPRLAGHLIEGYIRSHAMKRSIRRLARSRTFHLALGLAWLPYMAMRCVDNPVTHEGCGVMAAEHRRAEERPGTSGRSHQNDRDAVEQHSTEHHDHAGHEHSRPVHTCCELTGKYNITVSSTIPLSPPVEIATFATPSAGMGWQGGTRWYAPPVAVAHAPPFYLLHSTLLI